MKTLCLASIVFAVAQCQLEWLGELEKAGTGDGDGDGDTPARRPTSTRRPSTRGPTAPPRGGVAVGAGLESDVPLPPCPPGRPGSAPRHLPRPDCAPPDAPPPRDKPDSPPPPPAVRLSFPPGVLSTEEDFWNGFSRQEMNALRSGMRSGDLVFLLDLTGSMGPYITGVKQAIHSIVRLATLLPVMFGTGFANG